MWPALPDSRLGLLPGTRKAGVQVIGVRSDRISLQQRHVQCQCIRKGDVNHHHLSDVLVTKQDFSLSGIIGLSLRKNTLQLNGT